MTAKFVSFEGVEGCGKSTLSATIAKALVASGHEVLSLREPGGTPLGEGVRGLVLDEGMEDVSPWAELFLMLASRAQLVREQIEPALRAGRWVLCDRYMDASTAYQGYGRKLGPEVVEQLNRLATLRRAPDMTLLLDLDPEIGRARQSHSPDRLERAGRSFHERVREGYIELAEANANRFRVLDASVTPDRVATQAWNSLRRLDRNLPPQLPS